MSLHHTADTSRDAFRIHKAGGKLCTQQQQLVDFLGNHPGDWTRSELADQTGIRLSAVCGRVSELIDLGSIEELPRRRCRVTGSSAHPVRIPPEQGALF